MPSEIPSIPSEIPKLHDDEEFTMTDHTAVTPPTHVRTTQRATIMIMAGGAAGQMHRLEIERVTIGRAREATIVVTDKGISRIHCTVERAKDGTFVIKDEESTNGTLVNGVKVTEAALQPGDRIQLGAEAILQFGYFDEAEELLVNKLYEAATRDPLTKALNRRAFDDRYQAELAYAKRHSERLVVVGIDLDHFKQVNDTYGHPTGDLVLREAAGAILKMLRSEDIFARYGGEEFVVAARGLSLSNGARLGERIRETIGKLVISSPPRQIRVTVSVGVAELDEADRDGAKLLVLADKRLYAAKAAGRNCVVSSD